MRAPKTCSYRDPERPSISCPKTAVAGRNGDTFRCEEHQRESFKGAGDKRRRVRALTQVEKEFIRERDFGACRVCSLPAREVDHIVEVADGGDNHPSNLQLLCSTHHQQKTRGNQVRHLQTREHKAQLARAARYRRSGRRGF